MKRLYISLLVISQLINASGDGSPNTAFGTNGIVVTPFSSSTSISTYSQFVQSDGSIVIAGSFTENSVNNAAVIRFNSSGALDTTFNQTGTIPGVYLLAPMGSNNSNTFFNVLVQPDKKILAVGVTFEAGGKFSLGNILVVRLNTDGTPDQTFNGGNSLVISSIDIFLDIQNGPVPMTGAALQQDGKIVITSNITNSSDDFEYLLVVRLNPDGSMDTSFGSGAGNVQVQPLAGGTAPIRYTVGRSVAIQPDQKIVVAGSTDEEEADDSVVLMRLHPDGSLDTTFTDGSAQAGVIIDSGSSDLDIQQSLIIQPDGALLVGTCESSASINLVIIRKNADGTPDTTFGSSGRTAPFASSHLSLTNISLQNDGKILASLGRSPLGPISFGLSCEVVRYTASGVLDTLTFNAPNGYATVTFHSNTITSGAPMSILQNGTIVVSAALFNGSEQNIGIGELLVSTPLITTTITDPIAVLSGSAQSDGIVTVFVDGQEACAIEIVNNSWSCTVTLTPGTHTAYAVAHYPGGNVNLESVTITVSECTVPTGLSPLSSAIINKYCPCV